MGIAYCVCPEEWRLDMILYGLQKAEFHYLQGPVPDMASAQVHVIARKAHTCSMLKVNSEQWKSEIEDFEKNETTNSSHYGLYRFLGTLLGLSFVASTVQ